MEITSFRSNYIFNKVKITLVLLFFLASPSVELTWGQWSMTNGLPGGNITTLSSNTAIIFAGTEGAGGFTSSDNGDSWIPARSGISGIIHCSLVTGNEIYAGTSYGVFLSLDYGQHWTRVLEGDGYWYVRSIISTQNAVYVGYEEGNWGYIWNSTDQGQTWHGVEINGASSISAITSMAFKNNKLFVSTFSDGVFMNEYGSGSWTQIYQFYCSTMLIDNDDLFIAGGDALWLYKINEGTLQSISIDLINRYTGHLLFLNDQMFASTSEGLYKSSDRGINWSFVDIGTSWLVTHDITTKDNLLFVSVENNGVFRTSDLGANWMETDNGIINTTVNNFSTDNEKLYCCDTRGIWSSIDGENWDRIPYDHLCKRIKVFGDTIYVITATFELIKKNKDDTSWVNINIPDYQYLFMNDFLVVDNKYYLGTDTHGAFRSTDYGATWEQINNGLAILGYVTVETLYYDNNQLYAGTHEALFKSNDEGMNWIIYNDVGSYITSISIENNIICAGSGTGWGIFLSTDSGETWTQYFYSYNIMSVLIKDRCIMAGLQEGFVFTNDFGDNWYLANNGLYGTGVKELYYYKNYIYAGIIAQGIWRRPASEIVLTSVEQDKQAISDYALENCYPNPFNLTAKINFKIRNDSHVKLTVYDELGKRVKILVDGEKPAGYYEVNFDGSQLASGIYLYRIEVSGSDSKPIYTETKKMILLK